MKKISLLIMILCLALCLVFAVSCTDPDTGSDTDTSTNTDTDIASESDVASESDADSDSDSDSDAAVDEYRIYIKDEAGNPLKLVKVTFCDYVETGACSNGYTNVDGYVVVPNGNYHVTNVKDANGVYAELENLEIHFQEGSKTIEIVLMDKVN